MLTSSTRSGNVTAYFPAWLPVGAEWVPELLLAVPAVIADTMTLLLMVFIGLHHARHNTAFFALAGADLAKASVCISFFPTMLFYYYVFPAGCNAPWAAIPQIAVDG